MHTSDITLSHKNPPYLTILEANAQANPLGLEFQISQVLCKSTKFMRTGAKDLMADSFIWNSFTYMYIVEAYVIHLLGTYVTTLCNWLILWKYALYWYLGRSMMCLILQETVFQDQVLKPCEFVQETSWRSAYH